MRKSSYVSGLLVFLLFLNALAIPAYAAEEEAAAEADLLEENKAPALYLPLDGNLNNEGTGTIEPFANTHFKGYVYGAKGQAIEIDNHKSRSQSAGYIDLGNSTDLKFGSDTDFTIAFWLQMPDYNVEGWPVIIGNKKGKKETGWQLTSDKDKMLRWQMTVGNNELEEIKFYPFTDDQWHHITIVNERNSQTAFYVDGQLIADKSQDTSAVTGTVDTSYSPKIGVMGDGTLANKTADVLHIFMDELHIYRAVLTEEDILDLVGDGPQQPENPEQPIDPEKLVAFESMRLKWTDYLIGGTSYDPADPDIAKSITAITAAATDFWTTMNKNSERTELWSDKPASSANGYAVADSYKRLRDMATAYSTKGSALYQDDVLKKDIIEGLDWLNSKWYNESKPIVGNWFEWEIGVPLALGDTMALMYNDLSEQQIKKYVKAIDRFVPDPTKRTVQPSVTETGANRMDKALITILRGIHDHNEDKIKEGRSAISQVFPYVTRGDGFYLDGSFIQHNNIAYTGSYGAVLLGDMMKVMTLLDHSPWPIEDANQNHVFDWVTNSFEPVTFRKLMMDMVFGRSIARGNRQLVPWSHILRLAEFAPSKEQSDNFKAMVKHWFEADSEVPNYYNGLRVADVILLKKLMEDNSIAGKDDLTLHKQLSAMDRIVHHRPGYAYGISMSSARIANYEKGTENHKGWYTGDGMTYLYNNDLNQFHDAFWATVNAYRLPGVTSDGAIRNAAKTTGKTWVGGSVIDNLYGAAGMDLSPDNSTLTGKKSWFMFNDELVALGAGISSKDDRMIETIAENRKLNEDGTNRFIVNGETMPEAAGWNQQAEQVQWAHLEGNVPGSDIGYYFPGGASLDLLRESRTGSWKDIDNNGSSDVLQRNYLSIAFNHGKKPQDSSYAYVLLPNQDAAATETYAENPAVEVISNTADVQAVKHAGLNMTGFNFWNPGKLDSVEVQQPASIMMKQVGDQLQIAVSDPTQTQSKLRVAIGYEGLENLQLDDSVKIVQMSPFILIEVNTNGSKGASHFASFEIDPSAVDTDMSEHKPDPEAITTVIVSEDSFIEGGKNAGNVNGVDKNYLGITNGSAEADRKAFLKFDLSDFEGEIAKATLHVYGKTNSGGQTVSDIAVFEVADDSWSELELNYNNAPAIGKQIDLITFSGPEAWRQFDVTPFVNQKLADNQIVSVALKQVNYNLYSDIRSRKNEGGLYAATLELWPKDTVAPVTKMYVNDSENINQSYTGAVKLRFEAADSADNGSIGWGVNKTEYRINGGLWTEADDTASVTLTNAGLYTIEYRSVDKAGNKEKINNVELRIAESNGNGNGNGGSNGNGNNGNNGSNGENGTDTGNAQQSVSGTISKAEGGELVLPEKAAVNVPKNAFSEDTTIHLSVMKREESPVYDEMQPVSDIVELRSEQPVQIMQALDMTLHYDKSKLSMNEAPAIYYYNKQLQRWVYIGMADGSTDVVKFAASHLTAYAVFAYEPLHFADATDHWAQDAIDRLVGMNILNGFTDQTLRPEKTVTRAEFVKMAVAGLGIQKVNGEVSFADHEQFPSWAKPYIETAAAAGIIYGYETGQGVAFKPTNTITRAELAVILARVAANFDKDGMNGRDEQMSFTDESTIPQWAKQSVAQLTDLGVINGFEDGSYRPNDRVTRAQAAQAFYKLFQAMNI
ncbi:polysaccharide lyase family 8 super-sandwich domain-containing protein [Paenibacillus sp. GXUN7292]|uniref:polysaccharide lyase family 8 super-sandwich domain-containing protein n=1 Tax=Paenibacillus sp. GXUN7292 TaxID=3422499 RepID=UPI003D7D944B